MNVVGSSGESPGSNMITQRGIEVVGTIICSEGNNNIKFAVAKSLNNLTQARKLGDPVPLLYQSRHSKSNNLVELEEQSRTQENRISYLNQVTFTCVASLVLNK